MVKHTRPRRGNGQTHASPRKGSYTRARCRNGQHIHTHALAAGMVKHARTARARPTTALAQGRRPRPWSRQAAVAEYVSYWPSMASMAEYVSKDAGTNAIDTRTQTARHFRLRRPARPSPPRQTPPLLRRLARPSHLSDPLATVGRVGGVGAATPSPPGDGLDARTA